MTIILALLAVVFTLFSLFSMINGGTFKGYSKSIREFQIRQKQGLVTNEYEMLGKSLLVLMCSIGYLTFTLLIYLIALFGNYDQLQYPSLFMITFWVVALVAGMVKAKKEKSEDKVSKVNLDSEYEVEKFINEGKKPGVRLYLQSLLHISYFVYLFIALILI